MGIYISKATLSISRECPACGTKISRDENKLAVCPNHECGWVWVADPIEQVVSISAGIEGKSSTL